MIRDDDMTLLSFTFCFMPLSNGGREKRERGSAQLKLFGSGIKKMFL